MNICGACGLDFSSVRAFDAHRVGKHEYSFEEGLAMMPSRDDGRRCLTMAEIRVRFMQDARGRWGLASDMGKAAAYFSERPRTASEDSLAEST